MAFCSQAIMSCNLLCPPHPNILLIISYIVITAGELNPGVIPVASKYLTEIENYVGAGLRKEIINNIGLKQRQSKLFMRSLASLTAKIT